ncbi:hypothetical protein SAY86_016294 [Trapa natans]|uniref:Uncharacterized protein n=1 Tax=Trapa natans TaxID=22666 RepID=A0AAN7QX07_TRANT|nr:hypothetical protein SAY86_016294 [Trapa natans]
MLLISGLPAKIEKKRAMKKSAIVMEEVYLDVSFWENERETLTPHPTLKGLSQLQSECNDVPVSEFLSNHLVSGQRYEHHPQNDARDIQLFSGLEGSLGVGKSAQGMAKRSDFVQKLLDDLRLRKERLAIAQGSERPPKAKARGRRVMPLRSKH